LLPPFAAGGALVAIRLRRQSRSDDTVGPDDEQSPLRLWSAIQMAVLFQLSMMAIQAMRGWFGAGGVLASAVGLGLTDVDALTVSMTRLMDGPEGAALAAKGIAVGVLTNSVVKFSLALALGSGPYRKSATAGLGVIVFVLAAALFLV
jgi:uncharacterized membrane protein (DUF4010 family)